MTTPPVPTGIDAARVTAWFGAEVPTARPPLRFELIAGGHSNLTFVVTDSADRRWVLRRPPLGHLLATAHDMAREHRIMSSLGGSDVPVPRTVGLCEDAEVNGAPFYVMDHVDGIVVRDIEAAQALTPSQRDRAGRALVETLARIHLVDVDAVGLGDLGRRENYIARQLKRWKLQFEQSRTRELPAIDRIHARLAERIPVERRIGIVHGDYRLDNVIIDDTGEVLAVLDWELCTLGDVLADLGGLIMYWAGDDSGAALQSPPTSVEGFVSADDVAELYQEAVGDAVPDLDFYVAFAHWRSACIIEGVYARYLSDSMGDKAPGDLADFRARVDWLAERADRAASRLR